MSRLLALLALGALLHLPCAAAPREVPLAAKPGVDSVDGRAIADFPAAADAVIFVLTRKLQLPMPSFTMELYADRAEFAAALVTHMKLKPEMATATAAFAKAAVANKRVLVNEPAMAADGWPDRLVTMAHEMVHGSQLELSGHRPLGRHQWLVEGFAEWIAFQVTHELGVVDLAAARADMLARVRPVRNDGGLVALARMDSLDQWLKVRQERGFNATYPFAYLVTEFLVERHSYAKVLAYFRSYRESRDAVVNFRAAFGEDLADFQKALDAHLAVLLR
ncbi:MAG: hypothetical protein HYX47_03960 [Burkholderiales bacterium]|nr:hypothetical protein [Burkholderiales bacterium]